MTGRPATDAPGRFPLLYVLPVLALLVLRVAPLAAGARTLYLRDVFHTHLEMKVAEAEALRQGRIPLLDPHRAGGQPLAGNPNALAFYPDTLLFLAAPPLWALSAHFWIHLLLAPFALAWMARALGLGREGAWVAGVVYALSGYFLSLLVFYNLVASATLVPAFVACCVRFAEGRRPAITAPATGLLWTLLLLSGDPLACLLGLLLAGSAVLFRGGAARPSFLMSAGAALTCGTLLAAPQIVEFLRVLGSSYRGVRGYTPENLTAASLDPRQAIEWLLPLVFGRPDLVGDGGFWGHRYFTDRPPYFFSLYPGLLAMALGAASLFVRGRAVRWAQAVAAAGFFLALGRFNPLAASLFEGTGGLLRYPVRFWILVAIGMSFLAGAAFETTIQYKGARATRAFRIGLAALLLAAVLAWLALAPEGGPGEQVLRRAMPAAGAADPAHERARLAGVCARSILVLALLWGATLFAARRPAAGGAALLAIHAASQLLLLSPLMASDAASAYAAPPPALEHVPASSRIVQGASEGLFGGGGPDPAALPDGRALWLARRAYHDLHPFAGVMWGRSYDLNVSSEGMDSFLATAARDAVRGATDSGRVRLLAAWGVDRLLLDREIDPDARDRVTLLARLPGVGGLLYVYEVTGAAPSVFLAKRIVRAANPPAALAMLKSPDFDPVTTAVVPGNGPPVEGSGGDVRVLESGAEAITAEVDSAQGGVLVVQRSFQSLYRARVDGRSAKIRVANLHHIGIDVPAGRHRVVLAIHRRPLRLSPGASALGVLGLAALSRRLRRAA